MVNKTAVIAIVLIVAVPIMTGYLMAFENVDRARFNEDDTKNVTDLITNDTSFNYMSANSYSLNSRVWTDTSVNANPDLFNIELAYPEYREISSTYTSVPMGRATTLPGTLTVADYSFMRIVLTDQIAADNHMTITVNGGVHNGQTYNTFIGLLYYDDRYDHPQIRTYDYNTDTFGDVDVRDATSFSISYGSYTGGVQFDYIRADGSSDNKYANTTAGYNPFVASMLYYDLENYPDAAELVPGLHMSYILITMDLRDLTRYPGPNTPIRDAGLTVSAWAYGDVRNEYYQLARLQIKQIDGVWMINDTPIFRSDDPDRNVWQFMITNGNIDAAYVGSWPASLGAAYSYQTISVPYESELPDADIQTVNLSKYAATDTERVRVDAATTRSATYPVMNNQTYSPTMLNTAADGYVTTIGKISQAGSSIAFAGSTYNVTDGSIFVGTKKLQIEGLTFRSEQQDDGTFANYIGGIRVPSTAAVPAISLNGIWAMIVQTTFLDKEIVTVTEWVPGEFAWNGVDASFALIGLMTCVAVFIALGMYGRRSGAKVGHLMLICGAAAFVFLALL